MKKVVFITGASSGIGKATAEKLISEGHTVYGGARSLDKLKAIDGLKPVSIDMTDEKSLERAVEKIITSEKRIDVLFNNAGYGLYGPIEDIPIDDARQQFEVNLFGLARLTQLVLPYMRKAKSGLIINTSSMGGKIYTPLGGWYHATKHALEGWSDCLRLETKEFGINVVIVEPGAIETNFGEVMSKQLATYAKGSAYTSYINAYLKMNQRANGGGFTGSPASVIADVVSKAMSTSNPKPRYVAGKYARPFMFVRKYFGDRIYDWALNSQLRRMAN